MSLVLPCLSPVLPSLSPVFPCLSLVLPYLSLVLPCLSPVLPGAPMLVVSAPRLVVGTWSYSDGRQECAPRVSYSPEIDASKFTLHILSDNPGDSKRLNYILLTKPRLRQRLLLVQVGWQICFGDQLPWSRLPAVVVTHDVGIIYQNEFI
jgi:hypothetical protein